MDGSLISIITPTYNHEKFIEKCIESVLMQSYQNWEQIIINDGSTDNTENLICGYNDKRIKYIKQENKGILRLKEMYNAALKHSNGQIIAILEGDDFWPQDKLEKQIAVFNDPRIVFSWGKTSIVNSEDEIIGCRPKSLPWLKKKSNKEMFKYLLFGNFVPACTVMCRKDALESIGGFKQPDGTPYVDHLTWLELGLIGEFCYLDEMLGYWRHHNRQISSTMWIELLESLKTSIDFFKKRSNEFKFKVGLIDLIKYNLAQVKYNIINVKTENQKEDNSLDKKQLLISSFSKLDIILKSIYVIFKINIRWTLVIIKNAF